MADELGRRVALRYLAGAATGGLGAMVWCNARRTEPAVSIPGFAATEVELEHQLHRELAFLEFKADVMPTFFRDLRRLARSRRVRIRSGHALTQRFLMSTDFFQNGGREDRIIGYVALYDPYLTPCYNPFA